MRTLLGVLIFLLVISTFTLFAYLYGDITSRAVFNIEIANVSRVIDGDTFETVKGDKVRLLGINTPEKSEKGYEDAKSFLQQLEGEQIILEYIKEDRDKYGRKLRYVFLGNILINEEILQRGFAHSYFYDEDKYTGEMKKAEEKARKQGIGIWKKSDDKCAGCLQVGLQYKEPESLTLNNKCGFECNLQGWQIKDEATHIYRLDIILKEGENYTRNFSHIWNDEGDSLFLRDSSGLLVYYFSY